jgi:radical SAM superfamily enzyme YgiQ (UPF0313 family)
MSTIVLCTLNARFIHAAVGLRYLYANMDELQEETTILEFEASQPAREILEVILQANPRIVGFGVYIWNSRRTEEVIAMLKKIRPDIVVVLGGPEVSYEYEQQSIVQRADFLIAGEADVAFASLCRRILAGEVDIERRVRAQLPDLSRIRLPYRYYSDSDIAHRVIYVEASRGCPFTCEFCLSSLDIPVRQFDVPAVLAELDTLFARGARTFKFVDRTFNLNVRTSLSILQFFLDRMSPGLFVHFEMVPDRFPAPLREVVARFPKGSLQLEIGIQTFNPTTSALISRRQDVQKLSDNIRFLREQTGAYLHVDLIAGLPGEDMESFGRGFDRLVALDPHEIQVGILKKLKGTPIVRHEDEYTMRFSDEPPFEVLQTRDISFMDLQRLGRFARFWDLVANSGNFVLTKSLIWHGVDSPFRGFMEWSDWLFEQIGRRSSIQLKSLTELLARFLETRRGISRDEFGPALAQDYQRGGRDDLPMPLKPYGVKRGAANVDQPARPAIALKRQQRAAV